MSSYDWPAGFVPTNAALVAAHNQGVSVSPLSGYTQTNTHPGSKWGWRLDLPAMTGARRAAFEAFVVKLTGREHRVRIHDFKRPYPRGTINLSGVVTSGTTAQFATSCALAGCGANATLLAGDWIKLGDQLVMVTDDATANGSGVMTGVSFRHMLRASVASGAAVTLSQPTALYILTETRQEFARVPGQAQPGISLDFDEVFA